MHILKFVELSNIITGIIRVRCSVTCEGYTRGFQEKAGCSDSNACVWFAVKRTAQGRL